MRRWRDVVVPFLSAAVVAACAVAVPAGPASAEDGDQDGSTTVVRDGLTPATAAASCWEIKQDDPDSADGAYWLVTPQMSAPQQFYCDQTTDGGGWVLIGRGRDNWDRYPQGRGDAAALLERDRSAAAFDAVQLDTRVIDGLLGGTPVSGLDDGLRVLRAKDDKGTQFQSFDIRLGTMSTWSWALGTEYPVSGYRVDGGQWNSAGSATLATRFGADTGWNQMDMTVTKARSYRVGFGYGPSARGGSTASSSFLWSSNGTAPFPYAELYLRPMLRSAELEFTRIDDAGTGEVTGTGVVSNYASSTRWGVTGNLNGRTAEGNAPVQAFAQVGSTVFVGGNFTEVRQGANGTTVARTALAAFDATTGEHIASFAATFDGQVKALAALPDGRLLVGGDFTVVNGERHVGTVVLDPATGQTDPSWTLQVDNRLSSGVVSVKSLVVSGDQVYLGGAFTHLSTPGSAAVYARGAARVSVGGTPDRSWNPEFNGSVVDVDASGDGSRFYAAGYFTTSAGRPASKATALSTEAGAAPLGWSFVGSSTERSNYQQAVADTGSLVFAGGSEHSLMGFNRDGFERVSGSVTKDVGGDFQAIATNGDVVYAGCHCGVATYQDAYSWPNLGGQWTRADKIQWVGAWDARTGRQLGEFSPYMLRSNNAGAWSLFLADDGALWVGGDFTGSRTSQTRSQWNGGWVRYPAQDRQAPGTPQDLRTTLSEEAAVTLAWTGVQDAVSYEVLRDDRVVATSTTAGAQVPRGGEDRFFVRAVDAAGNRSASTPVHVPPAPGQTDPSSPVLIDTGAQWAYSYNEGAPEAGWSATGFEDSSWPTGQTPIGYGSAAVTTQLTPPGTSRPVTAWFRHTFTVDDPARSPSVELSYVADDGAVVYVNGVEVSRTRMGQGAVTAETRADAAVTTGTAQASPTVVTLPSSVLVAGENVVAVETHLNYRSSPTLSFSAALTRSEAAAPSAPQDGSGDQGSRREVVPAGSQWSYRYETDAPDPLWSSTADVSAWATGAAPIGWGFTGVATALEVPVAQRARTVYFVREVDLGDIDEDSVLTISVPADDGVVVRVNGTEVGRERMPDGEVTHTTFASAAVSTKTATASPLVVQVPAETLVDGVNRIAVETHLNYRSSPNLSFDTNAWLEP
ncbi:MAG: fibrinogen-like YCDxxxxGGGW domain-containing protein [Actinomyces sp.]|uniref:fibrinogen-like YCDxxxxGGGW domain-containing protein n=1 Tax=Actinomyces sp. TaxID=29317 RepID=UPI0026DD50BA|nr:fibrinogen-like YCDxxxxGGGW domain-containing protein [Actinomyces sp.]MDO4244209.1 fibrinogen-like YCDxxxxGGGW domain-containing protein [Actinomyces sp.]